jgi:glutathione S-transferase
MTTPSSNAARDLLIGTTDGSSSSSKLILEYFAIEGVAEQVRIALSVGCVPFVDDAFPFSEWETKRKPNTKYGQVPEMKLPNGSIITDSGAMLRLAGEADVHGKLYPINDVNARIKIEMVLGLVGDMARAWRPAIYLGMRPEKFGHPPKGEWKDADVTIKKIRESFLVDDLPRYMKYFTDMINENGGNAYLTGKDLTIADISAYQQIGYFRKGIADHVPKECLDAYPEILAWMKRVEDHPGVAAYKAGKAAAAK